MAETPNPDDKGAADQADRFVPLAALEAERQARQALEQTARGLERQVATLSGKIDGIASTSTKAKTYTNAELTEAVRAGRLTESQAADIRTRQARAETQAMIDAAVNDKLDTSRRQDAVKSGIARYVAAMPALNDTASAERQKAEREFERLTGTLGYDAKDPRTQLIAMQTAFGSIEALEAAQPTGGRGEAHEETNAGGGKAKADNGGWPKDMPARNREYYESRIAKGAYTREKALAEWNSEHNHRRGKAA